jgi:hypothetical protein
MKIKITRFAFAAWCGARGASGFTTAPCCDALTTSAARASDANPASASSDIPEATVTTNLTNFLQQKVTGGVITQAQMNTALAIYNDAGAKLKIPSANLRAALVSLTGTFALGAIDLFLSSQYTIVAFQDPQDPDVPVAKTSARSDGKLRTIVRPEFQGEPLQALSAQLAHEALHQDNTFGLQEEEFANIVETLITAQQAQAQILAGTKPVSTFLSSNTALVNMANEKLAAMIQSGRTIFPYPGVLTAPHTINQGQGIFPGQKSVTGGNYTSFDDFVQRQYKARGSVAQNTVGNSLLNQYYTAITTKKATANMQFSTTLINDVDSFQGIMGTKLTLQLANALRMGLA